MRRFSHLSAQDASSPVETLLLAALAFLVAAAIVGFGLMMTLQPRAVPDPTDPAAPTVPVVSAPVLQIACGADAASVEGGAVDATPRGVPVEISGDDGARLRFASLGAPAYGMRLFEPSGEYALPLQPGGWAVSCAGPGTGAAPVVLGTFEVRDPREAYLRALPDCPAAGCCDDIVQLPPGFADDDIGTLHAGLADAGVLPTDTIERAGYAASRFSARPPNPLVYRVVRNLQIVARLDVAGRGDAWSAKVSGCPAA